MERPDATAGALDENLEFRLQGDGQDSSERTAEEQDHDNGREWDWQRDSLDVVIFKQPATAVYTNPRGFLVIRQESHTGDDPDQLVVIDPAHAELFILALKQAAGLDG